MKSEIIKQRAKAFDYLFDAVVIVDLNGIITDWNKGSEELYGYKEEEVIGKLVSILHVPEDVESVTKEVFAGIEKDGKWTGEIRMLHKDGHIGWIESMCVPFYDADNNMIGSLGVNRDITKRVQSEQKLKEQQEKLKEEVDIKNRFFSIIAHDLNSPFNQLFGLTNILTKDSDNLSKEEMVEFAKKINKAATQAFNLQKDLLEWSRSQFKSGDVIEKSISLNKLAQESISILKKLASSKNIGLVNEVSNIEVYADSDMIQTVLRNLISNAIKFSHPGGRVLISSEEKDDMVQITVSDNGIGIDKAKIEGLFMLDNLTSSVGTAGETGTGIGMALCKELIVKNGGRIWLDSTLGEGTQVHFTLPITS